MSSTITPPALHIHVFGPEGAPAVLALHGLTGHGRRWESFAARQLPGCRVLAPDLLGHGRSPWTPPWKLDTQVAAVGAVLDAHLPDGEPVVVAAHSYGSLVALALAQARPRQVTALVLFDPAQGLDPQLCVDYATATAQHWGYPDAAAAEAAKRAEGWGAVSAEIMAAELAEHLVPDGDRLVWRVSLPSTAVAWSEMAGPLRLPPAGLPTDVVIADRVQPPFVTDEFRAACAAQRADSVRFHHADTEHMVPFLAPELCGELVRDAVAALPARA